MAKEYGLDISCVDDIDPSLSLVSGSEGLMQAVARRWMTRAGELFYDPDYGTDIHDWIGTMVVAGRIEARLEAEALKDERVRSCSVAVEFVPEEKRFKVKAVVTGNDLDDYRFTLAVSDVTVELLNEGNA